MHILEETGPAWVEMSRATHYLFVRFQCGVILLGSFVLTAPFPTPYSDYVKPVFEMTLHYTGGVILNYHESCI